MLVLIQLNADCSAALCLIRNPASLNCLQHHVCSLLAVHA